LDYEFLYVVRIDVEAANHAESMQRKIVISVTVDGQPWPSTQQWDRTYQYDGTQRTMWSIDTGEDGEVEVIDHEV
jgi:hypothetical protein